ncbi:hypothetical protein A6E08_17255 [Vibrio lentus]|nr:hypothetical protein A6E08_17255 [Vibrio lentus]PMI59468.1 hypothetical protein BCU41_22185 [Vibrio lentus]
MFINFSSFKFINSTQAIKVTLSKLDEHFIQHQGQVIGAIGISGLSEDDDEALAEKVIQLVL